MSAPSIFIILAPYREVWRLCGNAVFFTKNHTIIMGNKPKKGFDYFSLEVRIFDNIKIRKLLKYQSNSAVLVYINILCFIYEKGYYIEFDDDLPFYISEKLKINEKEVIDAIKTCCDVGLFDKNLCEKHRILTSAGIQERYFTMCTSSKRKFIKCNFLLINSEGIPISSENMPISSEEITINSENIPQRKEKERKEKENKKNEIKETATPDGDRSFFSGKKFSNSELLKIFNNEKLLYDSVMAVDMLSNENIKLWFVYEFHKNVSSMVWDLQQVEHFNSFATNFITVELSKQNSSIVLPSEIEARYVSILNKWRNMWDRYKKSDNPFWLSKLNWKQYHSHFNEIYYSKIKTNNAGNNKMSTAQAIFEAYRTE